MNDSTFCPVAPARRGYSFKTAAVNPTPRATRRGAVARTGAARPPQDRPGPTITRRPAHRRAAHRLVSSIGLARRHPFRVPCRSRVCEARLRHMVTHARPCLRLAKIHGRPASLPRWPGLWKCSRTDRDRPEARIGAALSGEAMYRHARLRRSLVALEQIEAKHDKVNQPAERVGQFPPRRPHGLAFAERC